MTGHVSKKEFSHSREKLEDDIYYWINEDYDIEVVNILPTEYKDGILTRAVVFYRKKENQR